VLLLLLHRMVARMGHNLLHAHHRLLAAAAHHHYHGAIGGMWNDGTGGASGGPRGVVPLRRRWLRLYHSLLQLRRSVPAQARRQGINMRWWQAGW